MSSRKIVLVDVDETCAHTLRDWVFPKVNERFGTSFSRDTTINYRDVFWDWIKENWVTIWREKKIKIFNSTVLEDKWHNLIGTVAWSVEKIKTLSDKYDIWMLTARHTMLTEYTHEWARHHYGELAKGVLFSNCYHGWEKTKPLICNDLWAEIMIEDDMDYALELATAWVTVFLLKSPWNEYRQETHERIKRVDSWNHINL